MADLHEIAKKAILEGNLGEFRNIMKDIELDWEKKGFVRAEPLYRRMHKEWLDKGLREGAIKERDGMYYPSVDEMEEVGSDGKKYKKINATRYVKFSQEYEMFRNNPLSI